MLAGPGIATLNFLSLCFLLVCLRYGIGRERRTVFVWKEGYCADVSNGLSFMNLENFISRHVWNQLITLGGFMLGGTTFVAFRLHERHLRGVAKRRAAEVARWARGSKLSRSQRTSTSRLAADGHISLDKTNVLGMLGASLLTSLAASAALGVQLRPFLIGSPIPEYGTHKDSWVSSADMGAILYRSAHLRAAGASGDGSTNLAIDAARPRIGCCQYPSLRTMGVGIDPAAALKVRDLERMSPGMAIESFQGVAVGTNMSAVCKDESHTWQRDNGPESPQGWPSCTFTRVSDEAAGQSNSRTITVLYDGQRGKAFQTVLVDDGGRLRQLFLQIWPCLDSYCVAPSQGLNASICRRARVVACDYAGHDVKHVVRVSPDGSAIKLVKDLGPIRELSWEELRPVAVAIDTALKSGIRGDLGDGGVFVNGMREGGWLDREHPPGEFERLTEDILTDAAQGYFSVWRQRVEWWSIRSGKATDESWTKGIALQAGGGGWLLVAVAAAMAVAPIVALFNMAKAWDRGGELILDDICSDDGLSEDEDQALFIEKSIPRADGWNRFASEKSD